MKKKVKNIAIVLSILMMLISVGLGGYSYAKYSSQIKGNGEMDVAKWSFKVNESSTQIAKIKLTDTIDATKLVEGKVAPGTGGQFTFEVDTTEAEVGVKYMINFENEQNKPTNLIFTYNGQKFKSLAEMKNRIIDFINANDSEKTREITITWEWPYETGEGDILAENDKIDTQEGINDLNYTFDVVVKGIQVTM